MGRWLDEFLAHMPPSPPDIPDTMLSVSNMSGPDKDRLTSKTRVQPPIPPLQAGWTVAYLDHTWTLCGGYVDRAHAMVVECQWSAGAWMVHLTDGQTVPLSRVRSVGQTDGGGTLVAAWTVREHGYDGMRGEQSTVVCKAISEERNV